MLLLPPQFTHGENEAQHMLIEGLVPCLVLSISCEFPHQPSVQWGKVQSHSQAGSPQVGPGVQV